MIINKSPTFLKPRHFTFEPRQKPTLAAPTLCNKLPAHLRRVQQSSVSSVYKLSLLPSFERSQNRLVHTFVRSE